MDDFRGGKFIVGSDIRADEQRRMANEFMRNQNESERLNAEKNRNAAITNALGIANNSRRSNFLTQISLFTVVLLTIIILTVIAILAYQKAYNNQSLVDLDNLRELTLSDLTITDKSTMKNLTVTEDINVGDDLITTGGASINEEIKVGGEAIFYDEVWAKKGVSIDAGLSVSGITNLYNSLISNSGISTSAGLSVGGTAIINNAQITRKNLIFTSDLVDEGICGGGYQLTNNDGGKTYAIENKDSNNNVISNKFILPETNQDGLTYNFLWKTNNSQTRKPFSIGISANSRQSIYGTVLSAERGSSVTTLVHDDEGGEKIGSGISPKLFYYEGKIYPGSQLECTYVNNIWHLSGTLGVSVNSSNNGYVTENAEWLVAGASNNHDNINELLSSHDGRHYYDIPTHFGQNNIYYIAFGSSSNGTSLWNVAAYNSSTNQGSIWSSSDAHNWQQSTIPVTANEIDQIICGVSDGVSSWIAVGYDNTDGGVILNSLDGTCWVNANTGNNLEYVNAVAYGLSSNGTSLWVAGGLDNAGTSVLIYSSSGTNWQSASGATLNENGAIYSIAYGLSSNDESIWVAGGNEKLLYSDDGVSWENIIDPPGFTSNTVVNALAFGLSDNGTSTLFVAGTQGSAGTSMLYFSTNGTCWENCSGSDFGTYGYVFGIAYGKDSNNDGLWVATGYNNGDSSRDILISTDGVSWEFPETGDSFNSGGQAVAYNNLLYPNQGNALGL